MQLFHWMDWVNLLARWAHLLTGISWIGSSFYFMWLDSNLVKPSVEKSDTEGELWLCHSGGFYLVSRKKLRPDNFPSVLHWFKFPALFTWVTGIFLLGWVYYLTNGAYLLDSQVSSLTLVQSVLLSVSSMIIGFALYDGIWSSKLGTKYPRFATFLSLLLAAVAAEVYCKTLSGRAAFIHIGSLMGTIMVANVWMRILPAQRKMVRATQAGQLPDYELSLKAKRRSIHNSYMTFPVLFMMLSNHYPFLYSHEYRILILELLLVLGGLVRYLTLTKTGLTKGTNRKSFLSWWPAVVVLAAIIYLSGRPSNTTAESFENKTGEKNTEERIHFSKVHMIIQSRCLPCHSANPAIASFGPSPGGANFESIENIRRLAERIYVRAFETKSMPLANQTGITDDERLILARWVKSGASIDETAVDQNNKQPNSEQPKNGL